MKQFTNEGIPLKKDYLGLLDEELFSSLEAYSEKFLTDNKDILAGYSKKWVADPLHQWSRQWEYAYVFERIQEALSDSVSENPEILDAGSGVTFFPFYVSSRYSLTKVTCCDYDANLEKVFNGINSTQKQKVEFAFADLRNIPFADGQFDVIYCISVLEHTRNYAEIVNQFHRALKVGGRLILTFDISPDGTLDISPERALELLKTLTSKFDSADRLGSLLERQLIDPEIFTTNDGLNLNENLLPWRKSRWSWIKSLLRGEKSEPWPPILTFFCATFIRK